jgi:hypothetical protein
MQRFLLLTRIQFSQRQKLPRFLIRLCITAGLLLGTFPRAFSQDIEITGSGGSQPLEWFLKARVQENLESYLNRTLNFPVTIRNVSGETLLLRGAEGGDKSGPFRWRGGKYPGEGADNKTSLAPNETCRFRFELDLSKRAGVTDSADGYILRDPVTLLYSRASDPTRILRLELRNELALKKTEMFALGIRSPVHFGVGTDFHASTTPESAFGFFPAPPTTYFPANKAIDLGRAPLGAERRVGLRLEFSGRRPQQPLKVELTLSGDGLTLMSPREITLQSRGKDESWIYVKWAATNSAPLQGQLTLTYNDGFQKQTQNYPITATGYAPSFARNALLLYNSNSRFSEQILRHYQSQRPGASAAPVLGVALDNQDLDQSLTFPHASHTQRQAGVSLSARGARKILDAVTRWYRDQSQGEEYYLVLFPDIPTNIRVSNGAQAEYEFFSETTGRSPCDTELRPGVSFEQYAANVRWCRPSLHSVLNGTLRRNGLLLTDSFGLRLSVMETGSEADTRAYVDKLARKHRETQAHTQSLFRGLDLIPALNLSQKAGAIYYFVGNSKQCNVQTDAKGETIVGGQLSDCANLRMNNSHFTAFNLLKAVTPSRPVQLLLGAANKKHPVQQSLKGLGTDGLYASGHTHHYSTDGTYQLVGGQVRANDGYIIRTTESHNGNVGRGAAFGSWHGNPARWFTAGAFGGSSHNATPIAAYVHGEEPGFSGIHDSLLFAFWELGELAADINIFSLAHTNAYHVGDPFVIHADRARP